MRILYINVIENHAGWGAEYFVNRGFILNGHLTINIDFRKYKYELAKHFLQVRDFDVMLLQRGDKFPLPLLKAVNRPKIFWASELVSRCRDQDRLFRSGLFDHIFVRTPHCIDLIVQKRWVERSKLSVLLSGYDELTHKKIPYVHKDVDVLFIGSITARRKEIIDSVKKEFHLLVAQKFGDEMSLCFNRAKIVLNIHAENYLDTETRIYEALGCGAFVLTEKLSEESPFENGTDLVEFYDVEDLNNKIGYYLQNEMLRESISNHGYNKVVGGHSYRARAGQIAEVMNALTGVPQRHQSPLNYPLIKGYRVIEKLQFYQFLLKRHLYKIYSYWVK